MSGFAEVDTDWVEQGVASPAKVPVVSPQGTTVPRHIASAIDNVIAMFLSAVLAAQVSNDLYALQLTVGVSLFFGYFLIFEIFLGRTPGKFVTGLEVVSFDGSPCTAWQALIRTLLRIVEVNPLFLGGLPAAVQIIWTRNKQRLGDRLAGTVVVVRY